MGTTIDQKLVSVARKDRHAFGALVTRYELPLARYARRLGADAELAKDILQESFIKAYLHLNDFDSSLSFSAWMYRIVHNETITHLRRLNTRPTPVLKEEDLSLFAMIPDELDLPHEAELRIRQGAVQKAVEALDEKYRTTVVLRFFEHKSYDEISDILKIPSGTVATYLNRGKAKLKELLSNDKTLQ